MAEYQKNQELELAITALGNEGEGIGHTEDGYTAVSYTHLTLPTK